MASDNAMTTLHRFGLALWVFLWSGSLGGAESEVLIREVTSREVAVHIGGVQDPTIRVVASREASFFVENGALDPYSQWASREISVVVSSPEAPLRMTNFVVTPSPSGNRVRMDWPEYNQWAEHDIARFDIYLSEAPFDSILGKQPIRSVSAESLGAELEGLVEFRDHYLAVVPVDGSGNRDTSVRYAAAYILTKVVSSREVGLYMESAPAEPYRQWVSRELSVVVATPEPPANITKVTRNASPSGRSVTLGWPLYNPWAERDVDRYELYYSSKPFQNVSGMVPRFTARGEELAITMDGLPEFQDHFFAVVPVDGVGHFNPEVQYTGIYVLTGELASREVGVFQGAEPEPPHRSAASREVSVVLPDEKAPEPIHSTEGGLDVVTSKSRPRALELDWARYNEVAQRDVARYAIYVAREPITDVGRLTPVAYLSNGAQAFQLNGLDSSMIYHVAVVAEDAAGNFERAVRSVSAVTTPPLQMTVPAFVVDELLPMEHQLTVTESDLREYGLEFGLVEGPVGLVVASSGRMTWTPQEVQGPSQNRVVVRVVDNGLPSVTATAEFSIAVREVNSAPVWDPISNRRVEPGDVVRVALRAEDSDWPVNRVRYELLEGPLGMVMTPDGELIWSTNPGVALMTSRVIVSAVDDRVPPLETRHSFQIVAARSRPIIEARIVRSEAGTPSRIEVLVAAEEGRSYRLEAAEDLERSGWHAVASAVGEGKDLTLADSQQGFEGRFYRVVVE